MKISLFVIFLFAYGILNVYSQQSYIYKVNYISYASDIKNEDEGFTMSMYKYEDSKLNFINDGKELEISGTKDATILRFFKKIPWNRKIAAYANGMHFEDKSKGENYSFYIRATINKDLSIVVYRILKEDKNLGKIIDDVMIIYHRTEKP